MGCGGSASSGAKGDAPSGALKCVVSGCCGRMVMRHALHTASCSQLAARDGYLDRWNSRSLLVVVVVADLASLTS